MSELTQAYNNGFNDARKLYAPTEQGLDPAKAINISTILAEVGQEVYRATKMYKPMNSPHEAHSVILEELDEYWDEVKIYNLRKGRDTRPRQREELVQLAAMAIRAITDTIDFGRPEGESLVVESKMILAPLPAGIEDTPENRARLQAFVEGGELCGNSYETSVGRAEEAGKQQG